MKFNVTFVVDEKICNTVIEAKDLDDAQKKANKEKLNWRDIIIADRN